jgi:hypothetical protein
VLGSELLVDFESSEKSRLSRSCIFAPCYDNATFLLLFKCLKFFGVLSNPKFFAVSNMAFPFTVPPGPTTPCQAFAIPELHKCDSANLTRIFILGLLVIVEAGKSFLGRRRIRWVLTANIKKDAVRLGLFAFDIPPLQLCRVQFVSLHGRKPNIVSHSFEFGPRRENHIDSFFAQP